VDKQRVGQEFLLKGMMLHPLVFIERRARKLVLTFVWR